MTDFGGKLRLARERRGVSLRQIALSTKISVAALEALERNDMSRLPGGIFSRAFVRSYALEIGLDPDDTVREFLERFGDEAATPHVVQPVASPQHPGAQHDEPAFEAERRMTGVLLKVVVASFVIAAVIFYITWRRTSAASSLTPRGDIPDVRPAPTRGADLHRPWIQAYERL